MEYRTEHDSVGEMQIPVDAYYGVHTQRALNNFHSEGPRAHLEIVRAMADIKYCAAGVNKDLGFLREEKTEAIQKACNEIVQGDWDSQFPLPGIQGGAGTSLHMNVNEVIANRALEILGHSKGSYENMHPNDDVNKFQSTNDVVPSAVKIAAIRLLEELYTELDALCDALREKEAAFKDILKTGRTQLQDAMPITLGQEFSAYANALTRDRLRVAREEAHLAELHLGGTAIGTCSGAPRRYILGMIKTLARRTGLNLSRMENSIDGTQNADAFVEVSGSLKTLASDLIKISSDLRLMNSGPRTGFNEIDLPAMQAGSSIMPGKINPVIAEYAAMAGLETIANDTAITQAASMGQLELNAFVPVIAHHLLDSIKILRDGIHSFTENCVRGIQANEEVCLYNLEHSNVYVTLLTPYIGYEEAARLYHMAVEENISIHNLVIREGIFSANEVDHLFLPHKATAPGIAGADELKDKIRLKKT